MFKKIISLALAALLSLTLVVSCGEKEPVAADVPIDQLAQAVKDAYGEEYVCNMPMDTAYLEATYSIKPEWVAEFFGELPMIGFHVDSLLIIKPTEGNEENVLNALKAYYDYCNDEAMQYPSNEEKVEATKVYSEGGYCFYFTLGQIPMEIEETMYNEGKSEEEISAAKLEKANENNQKAVDAMNALFFPAESK